MLIAIHQPHYIPWLGYLDRMANHPLQELWSQFAAGAFAAGVHGVVEGMTRIDTATGSIRTSVK